MTALRATDRSAIRAIATGVADPCSSFSRENRKLRRKLARAELISDIQKKFAGLMGIELMSPEAETNESAE